MFVRSADNSWEPEAYLDCPELIKKFKESKKIRDQKTKRQDENKDEASKPAKKKKSSDKENDKDNKPQPKKLIEVS